MLFVKAFLMSQAVVRFMDSLFAEHKTDKVVSAIYCLFNIVAIIILYNL